MKSFRNWSTQTLEPGTGFTYLFHFYSVVATKQCHVLTIFKLNI